MVLDILRRVVFRPYRKGCGPVFTLAVWDAHQFNGKCLLGYRLKASGRVIFEGEDFGCSPLHAEVIKGIMCFLTLRPGDTDREYFDDYTPEQLDYCSQHAEALSCEVARRFGE